MTEDRLPCPEELNALAEDLAAETRLPAHLVLAMLSRPMRSTEKLGASSSRRRPRLTA